ncbi:MAG TPA: hypothetical protein VHF25_00910 [Nitriliruptorales bacterium]|nr:hypothetical protein [Nitriliruptorales bacterium]
MANEEVTGTRDEHYDLISVAYHAMHGAWNYDRYIRDAEENGDDELADFFRQIKEEDAQRGERAKQLLAKRLP